MNERDDVKFAKLLKSAFPAVADAGPQRDLWPEVLRRLDDERVRVAWFDWALVGVLAVLLLLNPEVILVLFCFL